MAKLSYLGFATFLIHHIVYFNQISTKNSNFDSFVNCNININLIHHLSGYKKFEDSAHL